MKTFLYLIFVFFVASSGLFWALWNDKLPSMPEKPIFPKTYFGKGSRPVKESNEIKPFKINIADKVTFYKNFVKSFHEIYPFFQELFELNSRIKSDVARLKSSGIQTLEGANFEYGYNINYLMNNVADYWLNKYDWKKHEKLLNAVMPQFITKIDGLDIHFAHIKPDPKIAKGKKVLPLLIVHGWPGIAILLLFFKFLKKNFS